MARTCAARSTRSRRLDRAEIAFQLLDMEQDVVAEAKAAQEALWAEQDAIYDARRQDFLREEEEARDRLVAAVEAGKATYEDLYCFDHPAYAKWLERQQYREMANEACLHILTHPRIA